MADELSPRAAAARLGVSAPTVVEMCKRGELCGRTERHGTRDWLRVDPASIDRYLAKGAPVRGRSTKAKLEVIEQELRSLAAKVDRVEQAAGSSESSHPGERDDMRARIITLQDAFARVRAVSELQRDADRERALVIENLQAALAAAARADELRRRALAELEDAVAAVATPGHPGDL